MKYYYDMNIQKRQTKSQLSRRGLDKPEINLADIGIIPLEESHAIDTQLYTVTDSGEVEIKDGKAHAIYDKAPKASPGIRRIMKDKVNTRRDQVLASGVDFTLDSTTHSLQTRDVVDLINWTNLLAAAKALPQDTPVKLRTAANKTLTIPAGKVVTLISTGIIRRTEIMDASWDLKDDIDNAQSDAQALQVYETGIDTVWPDAGPVEL